MLCRFFPRAPKSSAFSVALALCLLPSLGCGPTLIDTEVKKAGPDPIGPAPDPEVAALLGGVDVGGTALRRLSQQELIDSIQVLTGVDPTAVVTSLPRDALTPFDNDADTQLGSLGLVEGLSSAAFAIADAAFDRAGGAVGSDPVTVVVEAEDVAAHVSRTAGQEIFTAAGDPGFVVFLGEAGLRVNVDVDAAHAGAWRLTIVGEGVAADDPGNDPAIDDTPVAEVIVDGAVVDTVDFVGGVVSRLDVDLDLGAGAHVVDVVFANDFFDPANGVDRNLALDQVTLSSVSDDAPVGGIGPQTTAELLGCVPTGADDVACFTDFIETFGRRTLRRPLSGDEVAAYAALQQFAIDEGDFSAGARLVVAALLQDFEFLYRVEVIDLATAIGEHAELDNFAIAARLSFLLWGQGPDDELLDSAAAGHLVDPIARRRIAARLMADERARARIARVHALWLGTEDALTRVPEDLRAPMKREAAALIQRVIFDDARPWTELFTDDNTLIDDVLADHYGLPRPGTASLVSLAGTGRAGLLGQGAFLAVGNKFDDTSPTQRGKALRARLLCEEIPTPTPEDLDGQAVNTDMPPEGGGCKSDRYAAHAQGNCATCHVAMDPIGFGLEQYDKFGRFRTVEPNTEPAGRCAIDGNGAVDDVAFSGPAQLGQVLVDNPAFANCFSRQFLRFHWGRQDDLTDEDDVSALDAAFGAADFDFATLLTEFIVSKSFAQRRMPAEINQ